MTIVALVGVVSPRELPLAALVPAPVVVEAEEADGIAESGVAELGVLLLADTFEMPVAKAEVGVDCADPEPDEDDNLPTNQEGVQPLSPEISLIT